MWIMSEKFFTELQNPAKDDDLGCRHLHANIQT